MYLNIDVKKILDSKKPKINPLTESYNLAKSNQTPVNIINFMQDYKKASKETILENLDTLCDINSDITFSYFNNVIESAELSDDVLNKYKLHISSLLESSEDDTYLNRLNESISKIDTIITNNNDMETIREEMLLNLNISRIQQSCIFESYLADELEVLIYNINSSPEAITDYELIIRKIKTSKTTEYFSSFPLLLTKNTEMLRNLTIRVNGDVLQLLTSMPLVITKKLCETRMDQTAVKSYIKILDYQIALLYKDLKQNEPYKYQLYSTYVRNLVDSKKKLTEKYLPKGCNIEESLDTIDFDVFEPIDYLTGISEAVGRGGWSHLARNFGTITKNMFVSTKKSYKGLWPGLLKMVNKCKTIDEVNYMKRDLSSAYTQLDKLKKNKPERAEAIDEHIEWLKTVYKKALDDKAKELKEKSKLKESVNNVEEHIAEMQPDIIMYDEGVHEDIVAELEDSLTNIIFDPGEDLNEVELENFIRLSAIYEASAVRKGMIKAGHKAGDATRKFTSKQREKSVNRKRAILPIKKAFSPIANMISGTITKLKQMDKKERTERIINGGFKLKLMKYIKKAIKIIIMGGVGFGVGKLLLGPIAGAALSAIGILTAVAIDKNADRKYRQSILIDLKNELAIVNEKIEDAKGEGEKGKKYELMRIQQKLKKDIERIQYNLN